MVYKVLLTRYEDRSCPKATVMPPSQQLLVYAHESPSLNDNFGQNRAIYRNLSICDKTSFNQVLRKKDDDFRASPIDAKMQLVLVRKRGTKVGSGRSWLRRPQASIPLASTAVTTMRTWYPRRLRLRNRSCSNAE